MLPQVSLTKTTLEEVTMATNISIKLLNPYQRAKIQRQFYDKSVINKNSGCWDWIASFGGTGYGQFGDGNKPIGAHRVSYLIHIGLIPEGMFVCHKCDNRKCVNPSHLFLGTRQDNMDDMKLKNRQSRGEKHPSTKLSDNDVDIIKTSSLTNKELGFKFGVHPRYIWAIKAGKKRLGNS